MLNLAWVRVRVPVERVDAYPRAAGFELRAEGAVRKGCLEDTTNIEANQDLLLHYFKKLGNRGKGELRPVQSQRRVIPEISIDLQLATLDHVNQPNNPAVSASAREDAGLPKCRPGTLLLVLGSSLPIGRA